MRKVLHIIDSLWLWWAQTVVKWIFEWQKENNNIFLYSLRKRDINIKIEHKNIFINNSKNKFSFPIFKLKKFIKENNIKILHCHLAKSQIIWWVLKKIFFPNIKLIFHEHWEIFQEWKIYPFLMNKFRKEVDLYLAVSKATKNKILQKTSFNEDKIKVLYNFVDLDKFKKLENFDIENERKKYWLSKNDFVIWFASRFIEKKWWKEFLESAKILINKWYNFKFVIWWDGEDKGKIMNFIKENNLEKNIILVWYVDNMVKFYNIIDLFIFPSYIESMWLTQLEAQACGVPVIVSDVEWLNETINNNIDWLLFKSKNVDDLVRKIEKIYNKKDLREKLIKWWFENVKRFSLEKYLVMLNSFYEKV